MSEAGQDARAARDERVEAAARALHKRDTDTSVAADAWEWYRESARLALQAADRVVLLPQPDAPHGLTAEQLVVAAMEACERWYGTFGSSYDPASEWDGLTDEDRDNWCHVADGVLSDGRAPASLPVDTPAAKLAEALRHALMVMTAARISTASKTPNTSAVLAAELENVEAALREYDAISGEAEEATT